VPAEQKDVPVIGRPGAPQSAHVTLVVTELAETGGQPAKTKAASMLIAEENRTVE